MAPRSTRILIGESSVWQASTGNDRSESTSHNLSNSSPRRAVSDVSSHPPTFLQNRNASAMSSYSNKSIKRLSNFVRTTSVSNSRPAAPKFGSKQDIWMVSFTDVTLRCQRVGSTDIPDGFAGALEGGGKIGKIKRKGRERNLYKFLKIERWESKQASDSILRRSRARESSYESLGRKAGSILETTELDSEDGESMMRYE